MGLFFWKAERPDLRKGPFPEDWIPHLHAMPLYRALSDTEQEKLRHLLRLFIAEKNWEGCGGLRITDEVKVTIAAQA
jgi:Mlc titration factor MtfA (ptsG expression regulator)